MCAVLALGVRPAGAATVYMGPAESIKTLRQAFAAMKGGDTLVIRDGVYKGADNMIRWDFAGGPEFLPPSGTATAYTVIRAENEGRVIFAHPKSLHGVQIAFVQPEAGVDLLRQA